jgi:type VI secretion system protein ImpA
MASSEVLDFDALLEPLAGDNPAGVDVRADPAASAVYYAIKDARSAARAKERSTVAEDGEVLDSRSEWRPVLEQAQTLLKENTRDLEITAWLIEALVRIHGFRGLRDGFRLAREIASEFWEQCYPLPDEDGIEARVAPLTGLNGDDADGTLIVPIRNVPVTEGTSGGPYSSWQYDQGVTIQQTTDPEARQKRIDSGGVTLEQFAQAGVESSREFLESTLEDLEECRKEFTKLCELLDERCAELAPPSSYIRNALESCQVALRYAGKEVFASGPEDEEEGPVDGGEAKAGASAAQGSYPRSREDAFKTLLQLADFFRRNEPHSPISYALEQVVRWGRMSLPHLLEELIAEDGARQNLFRLAGIKKPEEPQ